MPVVLSSTANNKIHGPTGCQTVEQYCRGTVRVVSEPTPDLGVPARTLGALRGVDCNDPTSDREGAWAALISL